MRSFKIARVEPKEQFARNLRNARLRAGLSQEDLGDAAELHRTAIGFLERAERDPRLKTIVRLARALGVSASELLDGVK